MGAEIRTGDLVAQEGTIYFWNKPPIVLMGRHKRKSRIGSSLDNASGAIDSRPCHINQTFVSRRLTVSATSRFRSLTGIKLARIEPTHVLLMAPGAERETRLELSPWIRGTVAVAAMTIKPRMQGWPEVDPMAWDTVRNKESLCILFFIQHSVSHVFQSVGPRCAPIHGPCSENPNGGPLESHPALISCDSL